MALFLTFALLFSLAACNSDSTSDSKKKSNKTTFSKQVVVDNDECKIIITKLDLDNENGPTLKTQLENKTEDKTLTFNLNNTSINGVQSSAYLYANIEPGKKETKEIVFSDSALQKNDIGDYTDFELSFSVHDANDLEADFVAEETVHVYPYGEEKATTYTRKVQKDDIVLMDNDYVSVIATGYETDGAYHNLYLFLVNKSDKALEINSGNVTVNGFAADPYFWYAIYEGKSAFTSATWSESSFNGLNIGDFTHIEMDLQVYERSNSWTGTLADETVHYYPYGEDRATEFTYELQPSDQLLLDNEYIQLIATGCEEEEYAQVVNIIAINKSDKNIGISIDDTSVNGLMLEAGYWCDIPAGKVAYEALAWNKSDLENIDLGDFTDIEMTVNISDQDNWDTLASETIRYYPEGESNATEFNYTVQPSDTVLVDNDYVSVIITGHEADEWGDYELSLYYVNKSDTDLYISANSITVNGLNLDSYYGETLPLDKNAFFPMEWSSYTLEENSITDISEIAFTLEISSDYGWYTTNLLTEAFTLQFQ